MNKCSACGADVMENVEKCEYCGSKLNDNINVNTNQPNVSYNNGNNNKQNGIIQEESLGFSKKDIENNKAMAVLSYIFPIIPYLVEKESKWVRFHSIQGMNLWIYGVVLAVILTIITIVFSIIPVIGALVSGVAGLLSFVVSVGSFALGVIGIINVLKMEAKPLPIIDKIKIIKK